METLAGKVGWITGATSGIGRACALELARRGARVAVSGRREERLQEVVRAIEAEGSEGLAVPCDVRHEDAQAQAVATVVDHFGRLDLALANAGFTVGGTVEKLSADDWRRQLDTNVVGAAITAKMALPELRKTRGRLGLTGSVAAFLPAPGFGPYHCSKYALRALGQTLSLELSGSGVSCTTIHPGFVESEINQVDNRGERDPARTDKRPKVLMWSSERAARTIVRALVARRREVVFTGHGRLAAFFGLHFPGLAHFVMTRDAMRSEADSFQVD